MPITRTPIVDDSGQGTDGTVIDNAWKQQFYDQIDALVGGVNALTPWTPIDVSGAGIPISNYGSLYARMGKLIVVTSNCGLGANSSGVNAKIGGLPAASAAGAYSGFYQVYGTAKLFYLPASDTGIQIMNATSGVALTNQQLAGVSLVFAGIYLSV